MKIQPNQKFNSLRAFVYSWQSLFIFITMISLSNTYAQNLGKTLHDSHDNFKEKTITKRRFGYQTLMNRIDSLKPNKLFEVSVATKSSEGRDIYLIKCGTGKTKVMLWSQMHGDEPTATMAMVDIFNFLENKTNNPKLKSDSELDKLRDDLLKKCTFYFVPMLNPDGAEAWTRYTALGIDMNRDALELQTPEGRLLKKLIFEIKPDFSFNLHDKNRRYSAGKSGNLSTVSFLATAFNQAEDLSSNRKKAMKVIVGMNQAIQPYIPNSVGRWSSEYEPRAFGDNIQFWGREWDGCLILIESGGRKDDPEKQYIRKLNFVALLTGLQSITNNSFQKNNIKEYQQLPENSRTIFDLIIRNVTVKKGEITYKTDLAINRNERPVNGKDYFTTTSQIEEIGDMSIFFGTDEIEAEGLEIVAEKEIGLGSKADFQLVKDGKVVYTIKNGLVIQEK
ncbi:MAG: M14 family zinc carboxypeptidase [Arcicella sp.]|nr:M14 family zinc carboxypeptidase [Arcicella sp.]